MTPERWRHIQALFHEALEQPSARRTAFLDQACADDDDLRARVEALLAADDGPSPVFAASPEDLVSALSPSLDVAGEQIGPYRLERCIGRGGMGIVYRARDTRLDRTIALKFLPPHLSTDTRAKQRFIAEAKAASALDHPYICTVYDIGEVDDRLYIAMAYYEGQTLKERLEDGPLPADEAVAVAAQIAEALAAAHNRGIVHRDVKPGNVFLTNPAPGQTRGLVKLLDFGLAKTAGLELTQTGTTMGTVAYMSPEQARGEQTDPQTDLWALGIILYEMLSGQRPFQGEHAQSVIHAILHTNPPRLSALCPTVAPGLAQVAHKALAKDRHARYQQVDDMLADLRAVSDDAAPVRLPARRPLSHARWPAYVGLAAVLALLAVLGGFLWLNDRAPAFESIAVLPLDDFSADTTQAYFADGMTEALIAELAQVQALHVISRTSVMAYKNQHKPLPEIARNLGVDALIEGSVTRADGRIRVTVQLIEAATDRHLWAKSYERDLRDVLTLQGEVARAIVEEIRVRLTPQEQTRLATARPIEPAAHETYLKGRYRWNKRTPADLQKADSLFHAALDLDPTYAQAYAGLAETYSLLVWYSGVPPKDAFPKAKAAALQALALDSTLADAHTVLGQVAFLYDWDRNAAERIFHRALAFNPNLATARHLYGQFLSLSGRFDEGIAQLEQALALDPLSHVIAMDLGSAYLFAGRYDEAIEHYRNVLALEPRFAVAYVFLGLVYEQQGRYDEAVAAQQTAIEIGGRTPLWLAALGRAYAVAGRDVEARAILDELEELSARQFVSPFGLALLYAGLSDVEKALEALNRAYEVRDPYMIYLPLHPQLDNLRTAPRFSALMQKMGYATP